MKLENLLVVLSALAGACSKAPSPNFAENVRSAPKVLTVSKSVRTELATIKEAVPTTGLQIWMKKDFWLERSIWVSLGVERASVTGMAMSVDGYRAARLSRAGSYLVLSRDNQGTYGGSVLGPDLPLNAYPIVGETDTEILVDLAAPKTPYGLTLANFNEGPTSTVDAELQPRFEFVRDVQTTETSLSFTTVTTLRSATKLFEKDERSAEAVSGQDPHLLSMTLRTDWVIPAENTGFVKKVNIGNSLGFFLTPKRLTGDGLKTEELVQKIATSKPFVWEISANTPAEFRPAIEQAILGWNGPLGKDVLKVTYANDAGSITKPTTSNLIWDDNMAIGFAFANWRNDPATGEIVQAQIYLSGRMWASVAQQTFMLRQIEQQIRNSSGMARDAALGSPERAAAVAALAKTQAKLRELMRDAGKMASALKPNKRFFIGLNSTLAADRATHNEFCFRGADLAGEVATMETVDADLDALLKQLDQDSKAERKPDIAVSEHDYPTHLPYPSAGMDSPTFAKSVIRAVVMHEVGHTIGLRHNFLGSLGTSTAQNAEVESASIMDYNDLVVDAEFTEPGSYDQSVVASEYQDKPIVENLKYCSDELASLGLPTCAPFDFSGNPLRGQHVIEESNLVLARGLIEMGQAEMGIALIRRALVSNIQKVHFALFPTELAAQTLKDPTIIDSQKLAWRLIVQSLSMQDMGWPADLVQSYKEILVTLLSQSTTPDAAGSVNSTDLVNLFKEVIVNPANDNSYAVRRAAVVGLQAIQSSTGRQVLSQALRELSEKPDSFPNTTSDTQSKDQDLAVTIKKILQIDGYYKVAAK